MTTEARRSTLVRKLTGVGYRVKQEGRTLVFDVGLSHSVRFDRPLGVESAVDASSTSITLRPVDETVASKVLLGDVAARIVKIRPSSPYTGTGIALEGRWRRPLKSTKTSKK